MSFSPPKDTLYLDATYGLHYPEGWKLLLHINVYLFALNNYEGMSYTDGAPADLLEFAHPHWSSFPPVHPAIQHFLGISFFFLWIINFVGNGLVMYIFLK